MEFERENSNVFRSAVVEARRADLASIHRLAYVSEATDLFGPDDLRDIERKSMARNVELDITGILVMDEGKILQILEGEKDSVIGLYERIMNDPRHESVKQVAGSDQDNRLLTSWNLVTGQASSAPEALRKEFRQLHQRLSTQARLQDVSVEEVELLKVITLFKSIPA